MKWIGALIAVAAILSIGSSTLYSACGYTSEYFGTGPADNLAYADSTNLVFKAFSPDPAWVSRIAAMGNNSWINTCSASVNLPQWLQPWGHDEVNMVYINSIEAFFLHAGCGGPGYSSNSWLYHTASNRWIQMWPNYSKGPTGDLRNREPTYPLDRPATRCSFIPIYNSDSNTVVVCGGANAGNLAAKTWFWYAKNNHWAEVAPEIGSSAFSDINNMGFIPGFGTVVAVGSPTMKTFVFVPDQKKWVQIATKGEPSNAALSKMVWASKQKVLFLYAYTDNSAWAFNPADSSWTNITPSDTSKPHPVYHYRQGMAYDSENGVAIMFTGKGCTHRGPWIYHFDTREWELMSGAPGLDGYHSPQMCYDTKLNVCLMRVPQYPGWHVYRYKSQSLKSENAARTAEAAVFLSAFPQPSRQEVTIGWSGIKRQSISRLTVTGLNGKVIADLTPLVKDAFSHVRWNRGTFPAGIYCARMTGQGFEKSVKIVLF